MKDTNCKNCGAPLNENNKCEYCYTIHHYKFETQNNAIQHNYKTSMSLSMIEAVVVGLAVVVPYSCLNKLKQLKK